MAFQSGVLNTDSDLYRGSHTPVERGQYLVPEGISSLGSRLTDLRPLQPRISDLRKRVHNVLMKCKQIREAESSLRRNVSSMTPEDWDTSVLEVETLRGSVTAQSPRNLFGGAESALKKRLNKRARLKRRKALMRRKREEVHADRKDIRLLLVEHQEEEEEHRVAVDGAMRDVNKRKATGRRYLSLLSALVQLRAARVHTATGRGERVATRTAHHFSYNMEKLKELWEGALVQCGLEENNIRQQLRYCGPAEGVPPSTTDRTAQTQQNLQEGWRRALFGDPGAMPHPHFTHFDTFIFVRRLWDAHLSGTCPDASPLPVGWVLPPHTCGDRWRAHHSQGH